jgi:hypothetical protein
MFQGETSQIHTLALFCLKTLKFTLFNGFFSILSLTTTILNLVISLNLEIVVQFMIAFFEY